MLFYQFSVLIINPKRNMPPKRAMIALSFFLAVEFLVLLSPFFHLIFWIDSYGYHKGPFYNVLYLVLFYNIFASVMAAISQRRLISKETFWGVFAFNSILFVGSVIRFFADATLVMNFACLLAILVIFISFENPYYFLDPVTGLFNQRAIQLHSKESFAFKKINNCVYIQIKDYNECIQLYGLPQMNSAEELIGIFFKSIFPHATLFYFDGGCYSIISHAPIDFRNAEKQIIERFQKPWLSQNAEVFLRPTLIELSSDTPFNSEQERASALFFAMRDAEKSETKDIIRINQESLARFEGKRDVKRALENAIQNESVQIFLQPIVNAETEKLVGAEALARISDSKLGLIGPVDFIPIAEMNGSISSLGLQVFKKSCAFMAEYKDSLNMHWINVNLSPIQCMNKNLVFDFINVVSESGLLSRFVHLEITEESTMDQCLLVQQIQRMSDEGFRFSLDDYGSGYSNLSRISKLPLYNVKLDMGLVWEHFKNPSVLLPRTVETFRQMGFSITAEGVETAEMAEKLRDMGCDYLQGYYYSKPLPIDEFVKKYSV